MYEQLNTFLHLLRSLDWNRSVYQAKLSLTQKLVFYFKIACSNRVSPKWGPDLDPASLKNPIINFCSSPVVHGYFQERTTLLAKFSMLSVVIILPIQQKACLGYDLPRRDFGLLTFLLVGHIWLKGVLILSGDTRTPFRLPL